MPVLDVATPALQLLRDYYQQLNATGGEDGRGGAAPAGDAVRRRLRWQSDESSKGYQMERQDPTKSENLHGASLLRLRVKQCGLVAMSDLKHCCVTWLGAGSY